MTLDRRQALARLSDDHELFAEICRMYETDAPEVVRKLKKALLPKMKKALYSIVIPLNPFPQLSEPIPLKT